MEELSENSRNLIKILLNFKHMLLFLKKHLSKEIDMGLNNFKIDFNKNLVFCQKTFESLIQNDEIEFIKFVKSEESFYKAHKNLILFDQKSLSLKNIKSKTFKKPSLIINNKKIQNKINKENNKVKIEEKIKNQNSSENYCSNKVSNSIEDIGDNLPNEPIIVISETPEIPSNDDEDSSNIFGITIKYSCSQGCRFRSISLEKIKTHELLVHGGLKYKCSQKRCSKQFVSIFDADKHMIDVHGIYKCSVDTCEMEFEDESDLKKHVKDKHESEYLTCRVCNRKLKNWESVRKHIYLKHDSGNFKCDAIGCDFVAKFRNELKNHQSALHKFKSCESCGKTVSYAYYPRHVKLHKNIKSHFCSWPDCGKSFFDGKSLKDHVRVHLSFKRYCCKWPECKYRCEQQSNLITHIRVKHFKLPQTKKRQQELNIPMNTPLNLHDFVEKINEDIFMK